MPKQPAQIPATAAYLHFRAQLAELRRDPVAAEYFKAAVEECRFAGVMGS